MTSNAAEHDELHDDYKDIREAIAKLCAQFPGEYWRKLDREMAYPKAFVDALTEAGYLSVLIPEEYGGAGLKISAAAGVLGENQRAGGKGGGRPSPKLNHGTPAPARRGREKGKKVAEKCNRGIRA